MSLLPVNDTSLYYEDSGPGSTGETIAFSHGLLWGTELFAPQVEALRDRYRCIAWDHRGQGRSAPEWRHTIDMEQCTYDAIELLDKLGAKQVTFVGLSMGGFVAMRVAARRPDLIRRLVLVETSIGPEARENIGRYRMLTAAYRAIGGRLLEGSVAQIMLGKTILADAARKQDVARFSALMRRRRDVWKAVNGVIDRAPISADELSRIRVPTLVIVGDEDVATPLSKAQQIVAAISGAKLEIVPRAGHSSTVEEPAAVTRLIEQFVRS
ncbi:MAG TPA: alpha/beta fold hydrolase [Kofleriaceae bacterium]|nr:alpha/beta fold hydrolase [Kofleriaceae bacterium]